MASNYAFFRISCAGRPVDVPPSGDKASLELGDIVLVLSKYLTRSRENEGFTLIELLVVVVVIGILLALAMPSYRAFRTRAADATAKAIIRAAMPAANAYGLDNIGSAADADSNAATTGYQGMTTTQLRKIDRGIPSTLTVYATKTTATAYCLRTTQSGRSWSVLAPGSVSFKNNTTCT